MTSPRSRSLWAVIPTAVIRPSSVAPIAAAMPIQRLRSSASISSVFEKALWNHFVVKPDQGNRERRVEEDRQEDEVPAEKAPARLARSDTAHAVALPWRRSVERKRPNRSTRTITIAISHTARTAP